MLATLVLLVFTSMPLAAVAQTQQAADLQQRIAELLRQVEALQRELSGQGAGVPSGTQVAAQTGPVASSVQCPYISRSLRSGDSGDDVARLQKFLALDPDIYPEALVTGYYGSLTERAVQRFQAKFKIVSSGTPESTGYGVTGPRTAAILALQCPDGAGYTPEGTVGGFLRVSPVVGQAPLTVTVQATVNTTNSCTPAQYRLDYGDGSLPVTITTQANQCQPLVQNYPHVYASAGTYTVTLSAGSHQTTATVVVGGSAGGGGGTTGSGGDTFSASPGSGPAPLTVAFFGVMNGSASCGGGSYTLDFGDNQTTTLAYPADSCSAQSYAVNHYYANGGNYIARLYRGAIGGPLVGSLPIAVSGSGGGGGGASGGQFSVSPFANGDPFTIRVSFDLSSNCAAFDLNWGDGSSHLAQSQGSCTSGPVTKEFTHTYDSTGTYVVTLKRGSNLSLSDSSGVVIQ